MAPPVWTQTPIGVLRRSCVFKALPSASWWLRLSPGPSLLRFPLRCCIEFVLFSRNQTAVQGGGGSPKSGYPDSLDGMPQSIHPSVRPSVHPSINPSIHQSINPSIHPSIHQSINPPLRHFVNLLIRESVDPSIRRSVDPATVDPAIHQSMIRQCANLHPSLHQSTNPSLHHSIPSSIHHSITESPLKPADATSNPIQPSPVQPINQ